MTLYEDASGLSHAPEDERIGRDTIAATISAMLADDGQRWYYRGQHLDEIAAQLGGRRSYRDGWGTDVYRWNFPDQSSLVAAGGGWDFPLSSDEFCFCWKGEGEHQDGCPAIAPTTYTVIRRSNSSLSAATLRGEILSVGGTALDLRAALVEQDARNLLLTEATSDRWQVEPSPSSEAVATASIEADEVYDFLVAHLGVEESEAQHLVE